MKPTRSHLLMAGALALGAARLPAQSAPAPIRLNVDLAAPGTPISPDLFGLFFEDLNYAADGGLQGELLPNRSFEYLTSLEHNGDVVTFASDAPMLSRRGPTQWTPDLIYFNAAAVFPSVNYTVQQLFMHHHGDANLPAKFAGSPAGSRLAASAVRGSRSGDLIVKIVNGDDAAHPLAVRLAGASKLPATAERIVFGGAPADTVNADDAPPAVVPHTETVPLSADFSYEAPANSLTILRIPGR